MKCLDEGTLRAYLDRELPEAPTEGTASHLDACAACRGRLERLRATAESVHAWLDALAPDELPEPGQSVAHIAARTAGVRWRWAAVALVGALAASIALFFAATRPAATVAAKKAAHAPPPQEQVAEARAPLTVAPHRTPAVRKRIRAPGAKPRPALDDFVPFADAGPMQIGMVVRVMLPVSDVTSMAGPPREIAADLIIGEDGRPRAIRFVR